MNPAFFLSFFFGGGGKLLDCSFPCDFSHERPNETRLQRHLFPNVHHHLRIETIPQPSSQRRCFTSPPGCIRSPRHDNRFISYVSAGLLGAAVGLPFYKASNRGHLNLLSATVSGLKLHFHCKNKLLSDLMHIPKVCLAVVFLLSFIHGGR